jgi:glycosyltransferase involved in cell wall biosynthesis
MGAALSERVSIIIPTRNRASVLTQCLGALGKEICGAGPCEVIVVDDCSADETQMAVEQFARASPFSVQCLRQAKPLGANAARNRGLELARGEIIIFLDDDVLVPPGWRAKLLSGFATTGCPVVTGPVRLMIEGHLLGKHRQEIGSHLAEVLEAARGLDGEVVPVAGNMASWRWVFDRARFDETLRPPTEEVDWLGRACVKAGFVPEAWLWHVKTREELRLLPLLKGAWWRGSEGGWWIRERAKVRSQERLPMALRGAKNCARAFGHALARRCWGGVVVGLGELARSMALVGLTNRGDRVPESWR